MDKSCLLLKARARNARDTRVTGEGERKEAKPAFSLPSSLARTYSSRDKRLGINHYPLDSAVGFPNTYRLDSDLTTGLCYPTE